MLSVGCLNFKLPEIEETTAQMTRLALDYVNYPRQESNLWPAL